MVTYIISRFKAFFLVAYFPFSENEQKINKYVVHCNIFQTLDSTSCKHLNSKIELSHQIL